MSRVLSRLLILAAVLAWGFRADAQIVALSAQTSTNRITVSNQVTLTFTITNLSATGLTGVIATNVISGSTAVTINSINPQPQLGAITTYTNGFVWQLGTVVIGAGLQVQVTLTPRGVGAFTNTFIVNVPGVTNAVTNAVIQSVAPQTDLQVLLRNLPSAAYANDTVAYSIAVSNLGPNSASGVLLTNRLPGGFGLIQVTPTNLTRTLTSNELVLNLGTLASGIGTNLSITVQPTNAGIFTVSANVGATGLSDLNTTNNSVASNITIYALAVGDLTVTNVSAMTFNPQNGLLEQMVRLSNSSTSAVDAVRVAVSGLTNRLFNAVGTNSGNPYVIYAAKLNGGSSVDLVLEYFAQNRLPFIVSNSQYLAFGVAGVNLGVSVTNSIATNLTTRLMALTNGAMLIEFPSVPGRVYTVIYSDNVGFSNAFMAQPSISAPADRVQWIDNGPPKTVSRPSSVTARFYKVRQED